MYYQIIVYTTLMIFLNSCSSIVKTHGYKMENPDIFGDLITDLGSKLNSKEDVIKNFGTPSIKVEDISNTWIYLVSNKKKNIFKKDEIDFQFIIKFTFDDNDQLLQNEIIDKSLINEISFSRDKTRIPSSSYDLADQIIDSFTRGR